MRRTDPRSYSLCVLEYILRNLGLILESIRDPTKYLSSHTEFRMFPHYSVEVTLVGQSQRQGNPQSCYYNSPGERRTWAVGMA